MNDRIFYTILAGFVSGIFLSSFFKLGFSFFLFLLFLSLLIFVFGRFFSGTKVAIILLALFVFSFGLGVLRYEVKDARMGNSPLSVLLGEKVTLTGVVTAEPNVKDQSVQLTVSGQKVSSLGSEKPISEKVLVSTGLFPEFRYGDLVEVTGVLAEPTDFETATGKNFAYPDFLAKDDIFYQIGFAQAKLVSAGHGSFLKMKLFFLKDAFIKKINLLIKEPESSLLNGLLLGAKNSLGDEWQTAFRQAGVSHIIALSGYNITIVAVGIMAVLSFLPRALSLSFGAVGIFLFAIMTGGTATVMRASLMALLVLLARVTGRQYDISRALFLAGAFMLLQNPKILVFDISFQLSFLSTLALIYISPLVEKKMTFVTEKYKLRELIVATVATQIFVLPFLFYKMGLVSVFSLFTNVLILPLIPPIMFLGFFSGFLGFISSFLAFPLAVLSSWLLSYVLKVIEIFSHLPASSLTLKSFPLILVVFIYGAFLFVIWRSKNFSPPGYSGRTGKIKNHETF